MVPGFTLKGQDSISTPAGGFFTLFLLILIIFYGAHKSDMLLNKLNPIVNKITQPEAIDDQEVINIGQSNFRFAFTLENIYRTDIKNDPAFMRWRVRHYGRKDGVKFQNILPIHNCTADDLAQFYPVST